MAVAGLPVAEMPGSRLRALGGVGVEDLDVQDVVHQRRVPG
jgi:hypothetical protein